MQIANPIYDVVFKYMMDDFKVAKLVLSALLEMEVIELNLMPQEFIVSSEEIKPEIESKFKLNFNVYRMDFSARVKTKDNTTKLIIIEIQKAKIFTTPLRFRAYLGKQFLNKNNYYEVETSSRKYKAGIPIISIYFLGEPYNDALSNIPVIKIGLDITDNFTKKKIIVNDPFIDSLYHQVIIINIPALKLKRRNELEIFLNIFNQNNMTPNHHTLLIDETEIPEKFKPVLERLAQAVQNSEVQKYMQIEDDFLAELDMYYDSLEEERKMKEEERKMKEEERKMKRKKKQSRNIKTLFNS
ncbi:MAG: hypothetical protein IPN86_07630 [Saprospiraceae bacterium]|nr:hypothetical protein [Saprospiraceae bacterium]